MRHTGIMYGFEEGSAMAMSSFRLSLSNSLVRPVRGLEMRKNPSAADKTLMTASQVILTLSSSTT